MTQTVRQRTTGLTLHMLRQYILFTLMLWGGFLIFTGVLVFVVSIFREIEVSGWEQASTQLARWYLLFIGVHIGYSALPLHVANGQTRRSFARLAASFIIGLAAFGAVLVAAGFVAESALYTLAGWPQAISLSHLFTSPWELHLISIEFWLRFMVWAGAGVLLGAAFYRDQGLGGILIPLAIVLIAGAEMALAPGDWWPFGDVPPFLQFGLADVPVLAGVLVPLASSLVMAAIAWSVVKDIPLRNKGA